MSYQNINIGRPSQTGDSFARIGPGGINLTEIINQQNALLAALEESH